MQPSEVVSEIFDVFIEHGDGTYGEGVTERQHALQCAALAQRAGESPGLIAACLLHDYGHLVHGLGEDIADKGVDARHERVGANRLETWFPAEVVEPVRLHAAAKRYLCWKDPQYFQGLSGASQKSLALQGGPMSDSEAREFETHPHFDRAVRLRRYDDQGKVPGMITPGLEDFRALLESFVRF